MLLTYAFWIISGEGPFFSQSIMSWCMVLQIMTHTPLLSHAIPHHFHNTHTGLDLVQWDKTTDHILAFNLCTMPDQQQERSSQTGITLLRVWDLESHSPASVWVGSIANVNDRGNLLNFSVSQFHLWNGDKNKSYFLGLLWPLKWGNICKSNYNN